MADYNSLKATIDANIRANGVQAITGPVLNACLKAMITVLGNGYQLQGSIAQPGDDPSVPDARVAYVASGPGTYTDFGGVVIPDDGHAYMLTWDTQWTAVQLPVPTSAALSALATVVAGKQDILTFDPSPVSGSLNPVTSGGIFSAIEHAKGAAGLAEALLDTDSEGAEQEFSLRKSGGDGGAYFRRLLGNTKAFNQMVENGDFSNGTTGWGGITSLVDGVATVVKTATGAATTANISQSNKPYINGHTYLFVALAKSNNATTYFNIVPTGTASDGGTTRAVYPNWTLVACVWTRTGTGTTLVLRGDNTGYPNDDIDFSVKYCMCIDLTAMQDNSTTPEEFREKYPLLYYAYGRKLIHCKVAKVITKGANQWDEETESGIYNPATGLKTANNAYLRSKNLIRVFPSTLYYEKGANVRILYYDESGEYIGWEGSAITNTTFTTPSNAYYIAIYAPVANMAEGDVCINLSDAEINGQYFPYWERELALDITNQEDTDGNKPFAGGMMGAGSAADYANEVGGAKVMGVVDMGDYTYTKGGTPNFFYFRLTDAKAPTADSIQANIICSDYTAYSRSAIVDKGICINSSGYVLIRDSALDNLSADDFKTAMAGVKLAFELATPVPFTWKEPLNTGIKVSKYGTEEITPAQTENIDTAPFRAVTTYSISVANLIAALSALGNRGGAKSLGSGNQEENPGNGELIPEEESPKEEEPKEEETPVVEPIPEVQSKK